MTIESFFTTNNIKLQSACRRISFKYKKKLHNNFKNEVYSELFIYLHDNWHKYKDLSNDDVFYLSIDFVKKQFFWKDSPLKKTINPPQLKKLTIIYSDQLPERNYNDLRIEIGSEVGTRLTQDYLLDLHNNFNEHQINNIIKTRLIYDKLNLKDQVIYDLYINQNLSIRQIASKINTSRSSADKIIQETITNIKKLIEKWN